MLSIDSKSSLEASAHFVFELKFNIDFISEIFPLIEDILYVSSNSFIKSFLNFDAPTPTGSKITGTFNSFAFFTAFSIEFFISLFNVPIFTKRAEAIFTNSSTSASSSAIAGLAPTAKVTFAQSFTVT